MGRTSRKTRQKEIVQNELKKFSSFFTAEDLHGAAKKIDEDVGIATIYRFLKESAKKEEIHSYQCGNRSVYSTHKNNHSHFICEKCGKSRHITLESIDFIKRKIDGNICHMQIDVYGLCKDCTKTGSV